MAHVDQAKKQKIAKHLKEVVPKGWKYSLAVRNHSSIVMTIRSAPIDLMQITNDVSRRKRAGQWSADPWVDRNNVDVNVYHPDFHFEGELLETFHEIISALNTDNFDKSDVMTDYFHVGHYVNLYIGRWDKPFVVK